MTRYELKARAKAQLGNQIFGTNWMYALVSSLVAALILSACSAIPMLGSVAGLILTGPITFGLTYIYLKQARDGQCMQIGDVFKGFSVDFAGNLVLYILMSVFTFLWTLLFIIPGIIKAFAYSMAYYVKVDHPELTAGQCLKARENLMKGHKFEYFVLSLSFIGWFFVGTLCLGIGLLWVIPYVNATNAQFYEYIKAQAAPVAAPVAEPVAEDTAETPAE